MEKPVATFKKGNQILEIYQNCGQADDPRTWDNMGTMVCFHRRYSLGDKQDTIDFNDFSSWNEMKQFIIKKLDAAVILPLYMYDHSGITIRTYPFECRWDSGQIGFIYATRKAIRESYGVKLVTKKVKERAEKHLLGEVETYDQYVTNDVYGFRLKTVSVLADGNEEGEEETDSCWGFFGSDWKNNGIFDHVEGKFEEWVEVK